jgi:hypothetical protein
VRKRSNPVAVKKEHGKKKPKKHPQTALGGERQLVGLLMEGPVSTCKLLNTCGAINQSTAIATSYPPPSLPLFLPLSLSPSLALSLSLSGSLALWHSISMSSFQGALSGPGANSTELVVELELLTPGLGCQCFFGLKKNKHAKTKSKQTKIILVL